MKRLGTLSAIVLSVQCAFAVPLFASTLCVTKDNVPSCYAKIADAIAAAHPHDVIQVGPGTFKESLTITIPLSLSAVGGETIVDAKGLLRGFFVDGLAAPGLSSVHIDGFTIENAELEGVLVLNATDVSISNNIVLNNNQALIGGTCMMLPSYEPAETSDCGEGIHLQGADHSIVTGNIVRGNSGGILLSDDTSAAFSNVIANNVISDNPYACGITMAGHTPTGSSTTVAFGVFHNTVFGNSSVHNGTSNSSGAGIGIFASVPGTAAYGNVVVENKVSKNGIPGIAMHSHTPGQSLNDNTILGNTISDNGADTADAATPGPTGINLYAVSPSSGNMFVLNSISDEAYDVVVNLGNTVQVEFNSLLGTQVGLSNQGDGLIDATDNWWNCVRGPGVGGACSKVIGSNIEYLPFLIQAPQGSY